MFTVFIALAATAAVPTSLPSKEFVQACYDRARGQAERDFCSAGARAAKTHAIEDAEAVACFNKELTQMGMNMCAGREFERADRDLNLEWAKAKGWAKDDPQTSRLLLRSQRAWLKYRDAQCELMADEDRGGSIAPLEQGKCLTGMTRERTEALANFAKPLDQQ